MVEGDIIAYWSRKQKTGVADSTCYGELDAATIGLKEAIFVKHLFEDFGVKLGPIHACCDNKAAIDVIHNPGVTKKTAHYERRLFFCREAYQDDKAVFHLVPTKEMMADSLTKITDRSTYFDFRNFILGIT